MRRVDGTPVLLCRMEDDTVLAARDSCPHLRLSMDGGRVRRGAILCPRHGALFDLMTGKPLNGVTREQLTVLPTRVSNGLVFVNVQSARHIGGRLDDRTQTN